MPSLPNIGRTRRGRSDAAGPRPEPTALDVQVNESHGLTWVNLEAPTEQVADWLQRNHDFHPLDLEDVRSRRRQRAKIDTYDDYVFVVLHFPRFDKRTGRLQPAEVDIFVAENLVITIPKEPMKALRGLWSRCLVGEEADVHMSRGSGYLFYEIVDTMYDYCFPILDKIGFKLDAIEDELFEGKTDELVRDISQTKQEIINYRKIIKPQRPTLRLLDRHLQRYAPQDLELYFDDIVDKNERIWDLLEGYKEVAEALDATNETIITHRLNDILKTLTVLSAIVLPLSLIASIYGMNVDLLPFAESGALSLIFPLALMVVAATGLLVWFRIKRWL
jgi:magnesium transporter